MKIAVVTDSTAFLTEDVKKNEHLFIVPTPIIIDNQTYHEGVDIETNEYYDLLNQSQEFPKTSQPVLGEVFELYKDIAKKGYDAIISIHLSSGISGFITNLTAVSADVKGIKIFPFDSLITSSPMGYMIETALKMAEAEKTPAEIIELLTKMREATSAYLIVDDLNNLVRGGRLTNGAAIIGTLLKIKPILTFEEGKIVVFEKIRSSKKAFKRTEKLIGKKMKESKYPLKFFVIHANNLEVAEQELKVLKKQFPEIDISISHFGPVIGTHLGEKAIGIGWAPVIK